MNLHPVNSSRMSAVGWENNIMYIQFKNGALYSYFNVFESGYRNFLSSPSLGHELESFQRIHKYKRIY